MTAIRREAIEMLENMPEDKLVFIVQIMRGVNGLIKDVNDDKKKAADLDRFIMPVTERGKNADDYVRGLRDDDRV